MTKSRYIAFMGSVIIVLMITSSLATYSSQPIIHTMLGIITICLFIAAIVLAILIMILKYKIKRSNSK